MSEAAKTVDKRAVGRAKSTRDSHLISSGSFVQDARTFLSDGDEVRARWERIVAR